MNKSYPNCSTQQHVSLDNATLHNLSTKITTIKTIAGVLIDILPSLIEGYKQATTANLIKEEIQSEILPLLSLNSINLLKTINQLQEILIINNNTYKE